MKKEVVVYQLAANYDEIKKKVIFAHQFWFKCSYFFQQNCCRDPCPQ